MQSEPNPRANPGSLPVNFKKEQRLRTRKGFQRVFEEGHFIRGKLLNLWILREKRKKRPRIGIVVTRRTAPLATQRNFWKRRIREIFRRNQHCLKAGVSILVKAKGRQKAPSYHEIREEFEKRLRQAQVLKCPFTETKNDENA